MEKKRPKLVVIAGPTASGKSSLAIDLALYFGGEIINSDSMQVYRGMDIGTAKASLKERKGIVHHMIDIVDPDEEFNASIYCRLARPVVFDVSKREKVCFLVGGTGLYIKALLGGLFKSPPVDPELRKRLNDECDRHGAPFLHRKLKKLDPVYAIRIHPNDRTRVIRSLELINLTDKPLSSLVHQHNFKDEPFNSLKICLQVDRDILYTRINERSDSMIKSGLLEETQDLMRKGYSSELSAMKSLGYRHAVEYLKDTRTLEDTILQLQRDTRRYSKRQITWFKADPQMVWMEPGEIEAIKRKIEDFI